MTHSRTVELDGHSIDSGTMRRCFGAVMDLCGSFDVDTVLAGSIREDGPLPDTITDAVEAQDAIRDQAHDADVVFVFAGLLRSVAVGMVSDIGTFVPTLAAFVLEGEE